MLFTESQLRTTSNPFDLLDEAVYLTEEEARIHPTTIPVLENSSIGGWAIPYRPLDEFCSSQGVGLLEAFTSICELNGVDSSTVVLAIDEADLIEEPELVNESIPFVVAPISEYDPIYQLCEAAIEEYMETLDDGLLEASLDVNSDMSSSSIFDALNRKMGSIQKRGLDAVLHATTKSQVDRANQAMQDEINAAGNKAQDAVNRGIAKKQAQLNQNRNQRSASPSNGSLSGNSNHTSAGSSGSGGGSNSSSVSSSSSSSGEGMGLGKKVAIGAGAAAATLAGVLAYRHYQNKPKSVIAKRIAALRKLYTKTMVNFKNASDSSLKDRLKRVAGKIFEAIDKLMGFLQRKADGR